MAFWYNTQTNQVETDDNRGPDADVLGPYDTMEEAGNALQHAKDNTDKWDEEDRDWADKGASSSWDDSDLED